MTSLGNVPWCNQYYRQMRVLTQVRHQPFQIFLPRYDSERGGVIGVEKVEGILRSWSHSHASNGGTYIGSCAVSMRRCISEDICMIDGNLHANKGENPGVNLPNVSYDDAQDALWSIASMLCENLSLKTIRLVYEGNEHELTTEEGPKTDSE